MGLVDALSAEDRIEVKYSDFYRLVKSEAEKNLLRNAVHAGVPRESILKMLSGQNDELEAFREIGLTPDQIREMDRFYAEKCKEVAILTAQKDLLQKQLDDLMAKCEKAEAENTAALDKMTGEEATQDETGTEIAADPDKKNSLEKGKLTAVKSLL